MGKVGPNHWSSNQVTLKTNLVTHEDKTSNHTDPMRAQTCVILVESACQCHPSWPPAPLDNSFGHLHDPETILAVLTALATGAVGLLKNYIQTISHASKTATNPCFC